VDELSLPPGVDGRRIEQRQEVLNDLDARSRLADRLASIKGMSEFQTRARGFVDLSRDQESLCSSGGEPKAARPLRADDLWSKRALGSAISGGGRSLCYRLLLSWNRRLGHHKDNFSILKDSRLPHTDQSVSALLEDLSDRGLLQETLVYWTGDFGRTPKVNKDAGRDHWPPCQTVLMAGGGIRGGQVYGSSDPSGAFPHDHPLRPDDITATVFQALGLHPETTIYDQLGRPMPISAGKAISPLT